MIISNNLIFSDHQAITADAPSTNIIDLGVFGSAYDGNQNDGDYGKGKMIPLLVQVSQAFNNLTSLTVQYQVADQENFSDATTLYSETILLADLVAGRRTAVQNVVVGTNKRYLRLNYDVTGAAPTTGTMFAAITAGVQTNYTGA